MWLQDHGRGADGVHKVLLVDDEIFARQGLKALIDWQGCGYEIADEADNGQDAFELIRRNKPDLVVTDIRMPVLDGLGLIQRTIEELPHRPSFIIISGYDDFKYAQQAVRFGVHDFILKPIDEVVLKETLVRLDRKLNEAKREAQRRERLQVSEKFVALIQGTLGAEEIAECRRLFGIPPGSKLCYVLVEINDVHPWSGDKSRLTREEICAQVRRCLAQINPELSDVYLHEHRNRIGMMIALDHLRYGGDIDGFIAELQRQLMKALNNTVYVYAGAAVPGLEQLAEAFRTAKDAQQYKYVNSGRMTVNYERVRELPLNFEDLDSALCNRLVEHVEEMDEEGILRDIAEIFQEFERKRYAPEAIKLGIHKCVSGIVGSIRRMEIDEQAVASLEPIISWQDYNLSPGEIRRLLAAFARECARLAGQRRKENLKGGIQKIKAYIEAHYTENISLKSIAARFYMNPVYLGQLFKKTYGMYFNEFVLGLRINEAKRLLRQTDMRVYEIALQVGYGSADYFVTLFEKMEGMSPSEYRNRMLQAEENRQ